MELIEFFEKYPKVAIAFSGGVDSAYLLATAQKYAKSVKAYYVNTAFQPEFELEDAKKLSTELNADIDIIELDILSDSQITNNPWNRCYFCKKRIFDSIVQKALEDGFDILLDGTNASDDADDRPGMKALKELEVLSPLRICGLTKSEIRIKSKEMGLFTWDKPAYACLATRIPSGQIIDKKCLERTEAAENYLFSLGFVDFRVRTNGDEARLEIKESQLPLLMGNRNKIISKLKESYSKVCLNLEMRDEY